MVVLLCEFLFGNDISLVLFKVIIMSLLLITFGLTLIDISIPVGKPLTLCIFGMPFLGGSVLASSGEKETYWRMRMLIHTRMHSKALSFWRWTVLPSDLHL